MCLCTGTAPVAWGEVGSFPALSSLQLGGSFLNRTLPAQWGSNGSLSGLVDLELANSIFSGILPQEWGAPNVFKNLSTLRPVQLVWYFAPLGRQWLLSCVELPIARASPFAGS